MPVPCVLLLSSPCPVFLPRHVCHRRPRSEPNHQIYSGAASDGGSGSRSTVFVSRSSFELTSSDDAAFYTKGGNLTMESSRINIISSPPLGTAVRAPLSPGPRPGRPRVRPAGVVGTATSGRGESAVVAVVDGNFVARETFFAGSFEEGEEERVVVFEESDGREGEHSLVVSKLYQQRLAGLSHLVGFVVYRSPYLVFARSLALLGCLAPCKQYPALVVFLGSMNVLVRVLLRNAGKVLLVVALFLCAQCSAVCARGKQSNRTSWPFLVSGLSMVGRRSPSIHRHALDLSALCFRRLRRNRWMAAPFTPAIPAAAAAAAAKSTTSAGAVSAGAYAQLRRCSGCTWTRGCCSSW